MENSNNYNQKENQQISQEDIIRVKAEEETSEEDNEIIPGEGSFRKFLGVATLVSLAVFLFFSGGYNSEGDALKVVNNRISSTANSGEVLFDGEENGKIKSKDFTVSGGSDDSVGENKMFIWDFNSEDGDEVEVLVDGQSIHPPFILTNSPAVFSIPATCKVTIKGIKDSGGGISYAVKFPQKKTTIFNVVPISGSNTYTLMAKP